MDKNTMNELAGSQQELVEMLEEYLNENYEFRHNDLSDKFEIRERVENKLFRPLTREAFNSLAHRIRKDGLEIPNLKQYLEEYIYSEDTPSFNPIIDYLDNLPAWDGQNHIGELFGRIPGITSEQMHFASIWLLSTVAHWKGMDTLHGNETVLTLIGKQGCGKSTFCARLLAEQFRVYYLDHLNLRNKNDKEMALTGNLLVNLDELDQIKASQHAELKQTLSKNRVNGRPIYGRAQQDRKRFASFVSTTNNPRPLNDPTGSRRYLCFRIPNEQIIRNDGEINYDQLYAQALHELNVKHTPYWFTKEEVARIQELNADFQQVQDLSTMIDCCFRHPKEGEAVNPMEASRIVEILESHYPGVQQSKSFGIKLGLVLKKMDFKRRSMANGQQYFIVPRKKAA